MLRTLLFNNNRNIIRPYFVIASTSVALTILTSSSLLPSSSALLYPKTQKASCSYPTFREYSTSKTPISFFRSLFDLPTNNNNLDTGKNPNSAPSTSSTFSSNNNNIHNKRKMGSTLPGRDQEEVLTNKHFVLGTPLRPPFPEGMKTAVFASGCYWGSEKGFWRMPGVYSTSVGYAGGETKNPTYSETCSGQTGHTESVLVVYDPSKIGFADLLKQFWESHDPAQYNGQGGDHGTQYRTAIYTTDEDQLTLAQASKAAYANVLGETVHTEIRSLDEAGPFYYAHEGYQQYLARPGSRQYCSAQPRGVALPDYEQYAPEELKGKDGLTPRLPADYWKKYGPKPGCVLKQPNEPITWKL